MNATEATTIWRMVRSICPQQAVDEFTPDAWAGILTDTRFEDAREAVVALGSQSLEVGRSRYIEPGHIIGEVRRIRTRRIEGASLPDPPAGLTAHDYREWLRTQQAAIADGRPIEDHRPALETRPVNLTGITKKIAEA